MTCTDTDECALDTDNCDPVAICTNSTGSFSCSCPTGYDDVSGGSGTACSPDGNGHAVLIGHDFSVRSTAIDTIIGNAALLADTTAIQVLGYDQYADTAGGGEAANADAALQARVTAAGRTATVTRLSDYTALQANLTGKHVLLVYEQENTDAATLATVGAAWSGPLYDFLWQGGIVIVCDNMGGLGGTWQVLNGAGLMTISAAATVSEGTSLAVADSLDAVAAGLAASYAAPAGTLSFTSTDGNIVGWVGGAPVVLNKRFSTGHAVLIGHDYSARSADVDKVIGNSVFMARATGAVQVLGYTGNADTGASGEVVYTNAAISSRASALGRSWSLRTFTDYAQLGANLPGADVLLVYEQENATVTTLQTIGAAWSTLLGEFVERGGIVVVCDHNLGVGGTWQVLNSAGLMTITASSSVTAGTSIAVADTSDQIASGVTNPYLAVAGTLGFTTTDGNIVAKVGTAPVLVHKRFPTPGHVVLVGHDFYQHNASEDKIIGNAILLAATTGDIKVAAYTQYAHLVEEVANTNAAIGSRLTALGRTWTPSAFSDYTTLASNLQGKHVLLVYEQENTTATTLGNIGTAWATDLRRFVDRGGVVVVCDFQAGTGGTYKILANSGLMAVTAAAQALPPGSLVVNTASDPVASGLTGTFTSLYNHLSFTTSDGVNVIATPTNLYPVVVHKAFK
ncbi:MAG: hypothetical protein V2A73_09055 [Pseudomonadota bacterium]